MATLPTTESLWTVEDYLAHSWSPDCELVQGHIEERHVGEKEHSILQRFLTVLFSLHKSDWNVEVYPELRIQTSAQNFRVPDLVVLPVGHAFDHYLTSPPLIAIEILSPLDPFSRVQAKCTEYFHFGIPEIWVIDPSERKAYRYSRTGLNPIDESELTVGDTQIRVDLNELFAQIDA